MAIWLRFRFEIINSKPLISGITNSYQAPDVLTYPKVSQNISCGDFCYVSNILTLGSESVISFFNKGKSIDRVYLFVVSGDVCYNHKIFLNIIKKAFYLITNDRLYRAAT